MLDGNELAIGRDFHVSWKITHIDLSTSRFQRPAVRQERMAIALKAWKPDRGFRGDGCGWLLRNDLGCRLDFTNQESQAEHGTFFTQMGMSHVVC
jgi:hypothetical protein